MNTITRRRSLSFLALLAQMLPLFSAGAVLGLGITPAAEDTAAPEETEEEKKKREEKEKEEAAKKKGEGGDDEDKDKDKETAAKGAKPGLSDCLKGALVSLKGGTPAIAAAALKTEQTAHAATKAELAKSKGDLATAQAALAATQTALDAICGFLGLKSSEVSGLGAERVNALLKARISAEAIDVVAGIGIDPARAPAPSPSGDAGATTRDELHRQYAAITDPHQRAAFYAKHREKLLG